ncbi:alpha/beta hydrolase fold domain-containing protein [Verrucomicrobia bacterium]|jgi:acetyl esterase|nr:alpha/beta hydrolase fold domain-containing protein [Verrucomicrobiota bacterium]MDA7680455.1 alpha/beta hydrolase fold domain-containing protein [bacterium]MDA7866391.1 alpha/beta hydrolase fold domain-containing protein [Verrucomicrobiota bacterium]MDB4798166.1 alpha/beta hydrolase fold domain-containing protein [Verrucomicrobiota bacterium]
MKSTAIFGLCWTLFWMSGSLAKAQNKNGDPQILTGATTKVYKTIGAIKLNLHIFGLDSNPNATLKPAIVFFFGGGWRGGTPKQFEQHCRYFASRGMVAITADYRVSSRHGTKALQCVLDANSAIRWIRKNANELGVDPSRVAAGGGSAGGHLAACTGVISGFGEFDEDLTIGSTPNALVLFNPAVALAPVDGYPVLNGTKLKELPERMGIAPKNLSPIHHIRAESPPTIIFHGQADTTVPFWTAQAFHSAQLTHGGKSRLVSFPGMAHGFFNYGRFDNIPFRKTLEASDQFLSSLGFLLGEDTVESFLKQLSERPL